MTFTSSPITVQNNTGTTVQQAAYTDGTNIYPSHTLVDATGAIVSPAKQGPDNGQYIARHYRHKYRWSGRNASPPDCRADGDSRSLHHRHGRRRPDQPHWLPA